MSCISSLIIRLNKKRGFTLVELIISVGTLAIVGTIMIQLFIGAKEVALRSADLDKAVFLTNRIVESIKAERWSEEPLSQMQIIKSPDNSNELIRVGYYDENWELLNKDDKNGVFKASVLMKSVDDTKGDNSLYSLEVSITSEKPYFKSSEINTLIYNVTTKVYLDTPLEVTE